MPVRAPDGLIGRVIDAGRIASRVLLVTDRANIVPARILRGGQPVISTGRGDGTIDVRPLEVGSNPFKPGDIIVTSGTGGLYPPLVPIAKVIRLDDDGAIAHPDRRPVAGQLRHRRTAVRAGRAGGGRRTRQRGALMVRSALGPQGARLNKGPRAGADYVPAATVVVGSLLSLAADRLGDRAGGPTSAC